MIEHASWDSGVFGLRVGRIQEPQRVPDAAQLAAFAHVSVKIPQERADLVHAYERAGFRFVTIDYVLVRDAAPAAGARTDAPVLKVVKCAPEFAVEGFSVDGSRLMLDPELRRRMPQDFWDGMIRNHCREFADYCLCVVQDGRLRGVVSCFERGSVLDLFLVAVHPDSARAGVGTRLLQAAFDLAAKAGRTLSTNAVSQNVAALNFYARNGFRLQGGDVVLHYSKASP